MDFFDYQRDGWLVRQIKKICRGIRAKRRMKKTAKIVQNVQSKDALLAGETFESAFNCPVWWVTAEFVPIDKAYHLCYDEVTGSYMIAKFMPMSGWKNIYQQRLSSVTHWNDLVLPLDFELRNCIDEEIAEAYDEKDFT